MTRNRPYAGEEGWTEQHRAFRDWLMTELRSAGCDIRLLSPMGMAQVTVEHMVRQGWTATPPGDATEFARWLLRKRDEAASLGRRTRYVAIADLLNDYLKETDGTPDPQHH